MSKSVGGTCLDICAEVVPHLILSLSGEGLEGEDRGRAGKRQLPRVRPEADLCWEDLAG